MNDSLQFTADSSCQLKRPIAISNWLYSVALMVFIIVIVGGVTRLTESGLSITEWKPITGAIPPLTDANWESEFEKYKKIPEFIEINGPAGMTLEDFKFIYFWEWIHRLLGRLIGIAFAIPFFWFAYKKAIPQGYGLRLSALLLLGGMQGAIGWWMVSSGLSERTDVSHFRLATHLLTAFLILGGLVWTALDLRQLAVDKHYKPSKLTAFGLLVFIVLFLQLLFGAYTAGLNAGYVSNTWPLMHGSFLLSMDWTAGIWHMINNDPYVIHYIHRWWAWATVLLLITLAMRIRAKSRSASVAIHSTYGLQVLLGIATVLTSVNIVFAVLHQAVGALVVISTTWGVHLLGRRADV